MIEKKYISAEDLLKDSFELAVNIYESGYRPDFIVGVWRGGSPIGIAVQEMLAYLGVNTDHIAIRTSSYVGIAQRGRDIKVHGLNYIEEHVRSHHSLLIVDDVYDSGLSVEKIKQEIHLKCGINAPEIKSATPFYKPFNNQTQEIPDFYLYETQQWLVFPHELLGLTKDEIFENKLSLKHVQSRILKILESQSNDQHFNNK